jgi:hypothetical protein
MAYYYRTSSNYSFADGFILVPFISRGDLAGSSFREKWVGGDSKFVVMIHQFPF